MANVTVRDATRADVPAIAGLLDQLGYPASEDDVAARLRRLGETGADRLFVAELDGAVVGLAGIHVSRSLEYDEDAAKVSAIVVDERAQKGGVGRALMAAVEAEARERGCVLLFLTTAERRADAHAFYGRLGFEETGRRFAKRL
jgi:N-acetylglutamate synthase-like GNAT family acetyltransferase